MLAVDPVWYRNFGNRLFRTNTPEMNKLSLMCPSSISFNQFLTIFEDEIPLRMSQVGRLHQGRFSRTIRGFG